MRGIPDREPASIDAQGMDLSKPEEKDWFVAYDLGGDELVTLSEALAHIKASNNPARAFKWSDGQ